ncbi:hypothetical protein [Neomegalonema sp.]|uniref:hypothetical protein n=1 Tax=Neomegalonema sp. TaxID=2039713 RepID=UPI0026331064|nr:hypothetical protein [Neomegalonema sp.]MDD2868009.1 hypothetical protein [Neomegalonema sp.]
MRAAILSGAALLAPHFLGSEAASAQEAKSLIQRQAALEETLKRIESALTWAPVAPDVKAFDAWLKEDANRLRDYEFGIEYSEGFRILHVSNWNHGRRFMTEPYMTGDRISDELYNGFHLGGSLWLVGTQDVGETRAHYCVNSADKASYPPKPDQDRRALHRYYFYGPDGVKPSTIGSSCVIAGPVYARARLFTE